MKLNQQLLKSNILTQQSRDRLICHMLKNDTKTRLCLFLFITSCSCFGSMSAENCTYNKNTDIHSTAVSDPVVLRPLLALSGIMATTAPSVQAVGLVPRLLGDGAWHSPTFSYRAEACVLKHWDLFQGQSVPGYVNLVVNPETITSTCLHLRLQTKLYWELVFLLTQL